MYEEKRMAKERLSAMSPAETEILRILWHLKQGSVQEVVAALPKDRRIGYATVQTLLRRLEAKGYLKHQRHGRAHVFVPAVEPSKVIRRTVGDFVERLFGGDPIPLMLHLAEEAKLSQEDIRRLQKLIEKE
jgi:BlaI family transcriptional regulator, penicillinase repressor